MQSDYPVIVLLSRLIFSEYGSAAAIRQEIARMTVMMTKMMIYTAMLHHIVSLPGAASSGRSQAFRLVLT